MKQRLSDEERRARRRAYLREQRAKRREEDRQRAEAALARYQALMMQLSVQHNRH